VKIISQVLVLITVVFPLAARAADHFVSPTGSASWGVCTNIATPCSKSTAETNVLSGDRVLFLDGIYSGGLHVTHDGACSASYVPRYSAPDSQKIILQAKNAHRAIITGNNAVQIYSTVLVDSLCVSIRDFKIEVPDQSATVYGIYLTRSGDEATGNEIYYAGTALPRSGYQRAEGVRINASALVQNNYIHDTTIGVYAIGAAGGSPFSAEIDLNTVKNLSAGDPEDADCFVVNRNNVVGLGVGIRIFGNTCTGWVDDAFDGFDSTGVEVFNNNFALPMPSNVSGFSDHPTCLKPGYTSKGQAIHSNHCAGIPTTYTKAHCIDSQGAESALIADNYCSGGHEGIYLQAGGGTGKFNRFVRNTIVDSGTYAFSVVSVVEGTVLNGNFLNSGGAYNLLITSGASIIGQNNVFGKTTTPDPSASGTYSGTGDIVAPH